MKVMDEIGDAQFDDDFGTISIAPICEYFEAMTLSVIVFLALTCTSFSPKATRLTIAILAALSGFGFS